MLGSENGKASASTRNRKVMRAARSHAANMNATDGPLFESFCEAAATQMRAPYVRRHGAANVAPGLEALFSLFKDRAPGDISVEMETKGDGTGVLRTSMRDQPFIVDSVRLLLNRAGLAYEGGFHAVLRVQRDDNGVAVRAGHHCAQPVMQRFGVAATSRASLGLYNTIEDLDRLGSALQEVNKVFG